MSESEEEEVRPARPACPVCSNGCIVKWVAAQEQTLRSVAINLGYAKHSAPYKALEQAAALQTKAILRFLKESKPGHAARPAARKQVKLVADNTAGLQGSIVCCTCLRVCSTAQQASARSRVAERCLCELRDRR